MDLSFTKVTYDGELADFSEEDLRELVSEYEDAQKSNVAEFETAAEAVDGLDENTIEDFTEAREAIIGEIVEAERFEEVPLDESALTDADFGDLQDWREFVTEDDVESASDGDGETSDAEFEDQGKKAPVNADEETEDFAEEALASMPGLEL